ncbi:hypothetical protein EDI_329990 [Entamoeba dispar SAW760]|uniref:Uncharacterized protein n=1 Tax=Entamoeba dispar (strain ATCC PRA-260 / SAW760) TaxID=370354 RepID=B0EJ36_ENTDS|nr:uncharacterized protein EDI_329990 [Entamoeba dispar SAW760]EDR25462.1 hypothetical protein EDI_329990 [Entamoeba dispar SAW760]|eukprot:EDR25462.1 hypothetical protein EDI_329990 [Entamoeba dispar SAW760]
METIKCIDKDRYKRNRNYQSALMAFYIGLMNKHGSVEVMKQAGRTLVALPFLQVVRIQLSEEDTVDYHEFIERRIKEIVTFEVSTNVPLKVALLRAKKNRIIESLNLMQDLLIEYGYYFKEKKSNRKVPKVRIDMSQIVFYHQKVFGSKDILRIGEKICKLVLQKIGTKYSVIFPMNDLSIQSIFM